MNDSERPVVLCGLGRVGWRVLEFLREAGTPVAVVSLHGDATDPKLGGVRVIRGDCRDPAVLEQAGISNARGVVIVTSDDLVNVATAMLARRLNSDCRVVVRMFNQNLIPRLGAALRNTTALSVSALTAPLLALSAVTGDSLGIVKLDTGPLQIAEVVAEAGSDLVGRRLAELADQYHYLTLAHLPNAGAARWLHGVTRDIVLSPADRIVVCGRPDDLEPLLSLSRGRLLPGVRWAGWLRRTARTAIRTFREIDLSLKLGTTALILTLFVSTLVFRYGTGTDWAEGLYRSVSAAATVTDLHGEGQPGWVKVFLSILKIAGAALLAGFTAIFTQYLLRARLGGAFELRKIPDGGHVVVCGLGNVGFRCVEELVRMGRSTVAVEVINDNPFAATVRRMGVPVVVGDVTVSEVLRQARADTARAVIAATSSELANLEVALLVRELNPEQRVVVRLTDPEFARAVREAAEIRHAVSVPALAAPAFAAALYGDRVHTLFTVGGRTFMVIEVVVQDDDPCLRDAPLVDRESDYRFLSLAVSGMESFTTRNVASTYQLKAGDRVTAVIEASDLERLLRRDAPPPSVQ